MAAGAKAHRRLFCCWAVNCRCCCFMLALLGDRVRPPAAPVHKCRCRLGQSNHELRQHS